MPDHLPGYVPVADAAGRAPFEQAWGRAIPAAPGLTAPEILRAAAEGRIRALWIASDDWLQSAPDRALAEKALAACELVIVSDLFLTPTARAAHVVFPAASFAEKEGVTVNAERRLQLGARALARRPGARTDFEIFQAVARALGADWNQRGAEEVFRELARLSPACRGQSWATLLPLGPSWALEAPLAPRFGAAPLRGVAAAPPSANGDGLALLSGGTLFLQGSLAHRGTLLPKLAKRATAGIHPSEAARLGVGEGDPLRLEGPGGALELPARLDEEVPPGAVFVPYAHAGVELNRLGVAPGARLRARAAERVGAR